MDSILTGYTLYHPKERYYSPGFMPVFLDTGVKLGKCCGVRPSAVTLVRN
jgi:hypothetical protein